MPEIRKPRRVGGPLTSAPISLQKAVIAADSGVHKALYAYFLKPEVRARITPLKGNIGASDLFLKAQGNTRLRKLIQ